MESPFVHRQWKFAFDGKIMCLQIIVSVTILHLTKLTNYLQVVVVVFSRVCTGMHVHACYACTWRPWLPNWNHVIFSYLINHKLLVTVKFPKSRHVHEFGFIQKTPSAAISWPSFNVFCFFVCLFISFSSAYWCWSRLFSACLQKKKKCLTTIPVTGAHCYEWRKIQKIRVIEISALSWTRKKRTVK